VRAWIPIGSLLLCSCASAFADVYIVSPDGSGDFSTIQAAIDAAVDGDVITLTDGTFTGEGNRDLNSLGKVLTLQSQSGNPETCVIDCQGSAADPHGGIRVVAGEPGGATLAGITITGGYVSHPDYGSAVRCGNGGAATISSCNISDNQGNAVWAEASCSLVFTDCGFAGNYGPTCGAIDIDQGELTVLRCDFIGNGSEWRVGAIFAMASDVEITGCQFIGNTAPEASALEFNSGGAISISDCLFADNATTGIGGTVVFWICGPALLERCTFSGNTSANGCAAIYSHKVGETHARNCTFWGNACADGTILADSYDFILENCILAGATEGPAISSPDDYAELSCSDIYGNAGGDWVGAIADQHGINGNICADPLLCDPENGDFQLDYASPCAPFSPQNPECDLAGAWPVGCGASPVPAQTWGAVKALYRQ
jgi:hypothetical protein